MTSDSKVEQNKAAWRLGGQIVKGHAMIAGVRRDIERETDPDQIERLLSIIKTIEAALDEIGAGHNG